MGKWPWAPCSVTSVNTCLRVCKHDCICAGLKLPFIIWTVNLQLASPALKIRRFNLLNLEKLWARAQKKEGAKRRLWVMLPVCVVLKKRAHWSTFSEANISGNCYLPLSNQIRVVGGVLFFFLNILLTRKQCNMNYSWAKWSCGDLLVDVCSLRDSSINSEKRGMARYTVGIKQSVLDVLKCSVHVSAPSRAC